MIASTVSRKANRIAVSCFFFIMGLGFASWASRIPDIKLALAMNDAVLGGILLALPAGSMVSMPFSGWLVSKLGSKRVATIALLLYPLLLTAIGLTTQVWQLAIVLFVFGFMGNMCNISMNTQAVGVEGMYGRSIMGSFHGIWSLAGFAGALTGKLMISSNVAPAFHFIIICSLSVILLFVIRRYALEKDAVYPDQPMFAKPDAALLKLGLIAFGCMACEGTMFDWSGVYFQDVVKVSKGQVALGYTVFMGTMATGRFLGDWVVTRIGRQRVLQLSGIIITAGLLTAVVFPTLVPATIGFFLVGFGVSSVIPLVYSSAGRSKKMSPSVALAAVSSIGFLGFLLGPPIIGFIAHAFDLRWSFALMAVLGFGTTVLASVMKWEK